MSDKTSVKPSISPSRVFVIIVGVHQKRPVFCAQFQLSVGLKSEQKTLNTLAINLSMAVTRFGLVGMGYSFINFCRTTPERKSRVL